MRGKFGLTLAGGGDRQRGMRAAFIVSVLFLAGISWAGGDGTAVSEWNAMGTRVRLRVRGEDAEAACAAMGDAARAALEVVEAETSAFRADSAVARVSAAAGTGGRRRSAGHHKGQSSVRQLSVQRMEQF